MVLANPPLAGEGSSTNSLAGNGDYPVGSEEVGNTSQNIHPAATSSKCIAKEPKRVKLHRLRWIRELFFLL